MALITKVEINQTPILTGGTNRSLAVTGDSDARFSLFITRSSDTKVYNFATKTFLTAVTSQSRLMDQSPGGVNIVFPAAASGDTYTIQVHADARSKTEFDFGKNKLYHSLTVTQVGNTTLSVKTGGDTTFGLTDNEAGTSTGSPSFTFAGAERPTFVFNKTQLTVTDAVLDFGYFITNTTNESGSEGTWDAGALCVQYSKVSNGAGTDATSLVLDDVDDLVVGMQIYSIAGTYQSALRAITAINTSTKTLTLDGNETWSNDNPIIIRAYGPRLIKKACGAEISLNDGATVELGQISTSIRTELTSNVSAGGDIAVNGMRGIGKGATIRMRGIEKSLDTSGNMTVASVDNTNGLTQGSITFANGRLIASSDRPIRVKTKMYIDGSSNEVFLNGTINIAKYPSSNTNVLVDLRKILTRGTAS
mgnify:CR=1 FL=1